MEFQSMAKPVEAWEVLPNLLDYHQPPAEISWYQIQDELAGLPGGKGINIAHAAVDRHANGTTWRCAGLGKGTAIWLNSKCPV